MSGGCFDYKCFQISEFADIIQEQIDTNESDKQFDEEVIERLKGIFNIVELAGDLAREVEWLYSRDISEETFKEKVDEIMTTFQKSMTVDTRECYEETNSETDETVRDRVEEDNFKRLFLTNEEEED